MPDQLIPAIYSGHYDSKRELSKSINKPLRAQHIAQIIEIANEFLIEKKLC